MEVNGDNADHFLAVLRTFEDYVTMSPLTFLVMSQASLESIREVYAMYPDALTREDLYRACASPWSPTGCYS